MLRKRFLVFVVGVFSIFISSAQKTEVKGSVKGDDLEPIQDVVVGIEGVLISIKTDEFGIFTFSENIPLGEQVIVLSKEGYISSRYPVVINEGETLTIMDMIISIDVSLIENRFTIILSDDELDNDTSGSDNISGLLSASRDIFQRTAAFEFSSSFFRVRGLDSDNGSILINGIEMNKIYNGRPQWSNWGGLNDVTRNQELTTGLTPSVYNFGGVLGTTNINTRASHYRKGNRITYSSSNRSYVNRTMASHASGLLENGWAYTIMAGKRWGNEGFVDATLYNSNSIFASVEKVVNNKHSINFTSIYSPNRRGKSSSNTQEVFDLKGIRYNEYWGWQDGKKRNSRIKEVEEPIFILSHYWDINDKTTLNTNVGYQFGKLGNSRLDYNGVDRIVDSEGNESFEGGGANPSTAYYQLLPSYMLREFPENLGVVYGAQQEFLNNGQIDWSTMYAANITNVVAGGNSIYVQYEDRVDDEQITVNTILNTELNDNIIFNTSINYKKLKSENFASILDLLGGSGYLNVDGFNGVQFNLNTPNQIVSVGDKFRYNYNLFADIIGGYAQAQFKYNKTDFYLSGSVTNTSYQREGLYKSELFSENSFGKGEKLSFIGFGAKGGITYKITGKHLIDVNGGYIQRAPSIRNTYTNSRSNHNIVPEIVEEKITSFDASYIFRSPIVKAKLTGFYTTISDANEISFFYADGIQNVLAGVDLDAGADSDSDFIQEILQGINKKHIGVELGTEAQITSTIKLKGAISYGQYTYNNNPNLYLSSDNFNNVSLGETNLKNYRLAGGPQKAYSIGFEYRDPDYWWFGATANFFNEAYVDISPLTRSSNFYTDTDGLPFNDYDENIAANLLQQEQFDDYMVVNLVGGKSWKIKKKYVGFFASIGNVFNEKYKTGGYEQGRNANYRQLRDDKALSEPVFGPKYWFGRGTNYFLNTYIRF